jgi:GT2 family glycosyltransferase
VVTDDGSTDETQQVVASFAREARFPVRFVTHPHTAFHPARCRNAGVRETAAPHLVFIDGDCILPPDHIEQHLRLWQPGVVTCGYCVRLSQATSEQVTLETVQRGDLQRLASGRERRSLWMMHLKSQFYSFLRHPKKPPFRSGDFSIARDDFERVNGFDEHFQGWGCEDNDFGLRLRAAGVRPISVLHRTRLYHLYHPPAPTRPTRWKQGLNVAYLERPVRLTRCTRGLVVRRPNELTVHLAGNVATRADVRRLVGMHGWKLHSDVSVRADIELLCRPGEGRFTGRGDCRVLALFDGAPAAESKAHLVLSPSGQAGGANQIRLRLDDTAGLWTIVSGRATAPSRMAA